MSTDLELLKKKGISEKQIEEQLQFFIKGFPFLKIKSAASIGNGIKKLSESEETQMYETWNEYLQTDAGVLKFVPASGAASRMFKDLFGFLGRVEDIPKKPVEKLFFDQIGKFAFYENLNNVCIKNSGKNISTLISDKRYKDIVENLLLPKGLNYGSLPKGLLKFHSYNNMKRTPMQEHLVEGALYAANKSKQIKIHFTVSSEHYALFQAHLNESKAYFEKAYDAIYDVSFSKQKASTDTIAVDLDNKPFREKGDLVFRPGGHGALIENMNDLSADIIFIKNIDNVVPDRLKPPTVNYKKIIAGLLVKTQKKCHSYLWALESGNVSKEKLQEIIDFCENELCISNPKISTLSDKELTDYLFKKLNRPIRVCGMVKNEGEPGGGPFIAVNQDGTASPQILESSQINMSNKGDVNAMKHSTHFNPVDLVCATKDYKGNKFNLLQFVDKQTGFISIKSKNGKELKALELPGLWNGAMSNWNTIFVEVPIETFNPVKVVTDLLRPEHQ